jgi:hypothetical protein
MLLHLDFLQFQSQLKVTKKENVTSVYDPVRRKKIIVTPEEVVRQMVLCYLLEVCGYPLHRIRVEVGIVVNGRRRRCDIVVFDQAISPWLIVECKSPKLPLTQAAFEQAAAYNLNWKAPFLAITNGQATFSCALHHAEQRFEFMSNFPEWPEATGHLPSISIPSIHPDPSL